MRTAIVNVTGFIGDILFASSLAEHLKKRYDRVLYQIQFYEPYELLMHNPFIDGVHVTNGNFISSGNFISFPDIDIFTCGEVDQSKPATTQFQQACGIETTEDSKYIVYTNKHYDVIAQKRIALLKAKTQKQIVAYQESWEDRSFLFTKEEYERGIDIPPYGYGGRRRNINFILQFLKEKYALVSVGLQNGVQNGTLGLFDTSTYSMTASIIKNCDWMIGGEGGLTNLAAGVGTKTIITGDFIAQLYGWNGCIKKIKEPKMGPKTYFPNAGHVTLDPFLTDEEVAEQIRSIIG